MPESDFLVRMYIYMLGTIGFGIIIPIVYKMLSSLCLGIYNFCLDIFALFDYIVHDDDLF